MHAGYHDRAHREQRHKGEGTNDGLMKSFVHEQRRRGFAER
jgi:hypothetical protein